MSRIVYVNGQYLPYVQANVHIDDRGFQFGDSVYEVCEVYHGAIVDERRHLLRLERSLDEIAMQMPMAHAAIGRVIRETVRQNRVQTGLVYIQVSRGVAKRDFLFPRPSIRQTFVCTAHPRSQARVDAKAAKGIVVHTTKDMRWSRVDIKTTMLLASCIAKEEARDVGAGEAWLIDDEGYVTEGASSNAWIVTKDGELLTRAADGHILDGITRTVVMEIAERRNLKLTERVFTVAEAQNAREVFVTSASLCVQPVTRIDDTVIGNGEAGLVATELRDLFHSVAELVA
jgi:D-alanine transaminase